MNRRPLILLLAAAGLGGCASGEDIVAESLAGPHPADASAAVAAAPPPVPPSSLAIAPTLLGPTETGRVDPDPILPKMDSYFRNRTMPEGYDEFNRPVTRPTERDPGLPPPPRYDRERFEGGEE